MPTCPPPPPDTSQMLQHRYKVLECSYSSNNTYRALLIQDDRGHFRVSCEKWDTSDWEYCADAFWSQIGRGITLTDTLENARKLARERLVELEAGLSP